MKLLPFILNMALLCGGLCTCASAQESDLSNADGDGDGTVTVKEFQTYASEKLPGFERLEAFAKRVDANNDGEIDGDEFAKRMEVLQNLAAGEGEQDADNSAPQRTKPSNADAASSKEVKAAFEKIKKLVANNKWEEAAKSMTEKARDEISVEQVVSSIGLTKIELPMSVPQIEEAVDEVENVLIQYGLDSLDIDTAQMFRVEMSIDGDEDAEGDEEAEDEATENENPRSDSEKILKAIDKDGKRWEIVQALLAAKKSSPFAANPLVGKIVDAEVEQEVAYLTVKMGPPQQDGDEGVVVQIMMPPTVVRMKKVGESWKLDGRDSKRTQAAMEEFMKKVQREGGPGGSAPRTDF